MENEQLIPADDLCTHYHVEQQFILSLSDAGLIEITSVKEKMFVHPSQLNELEKFARMHYDLHINMEGIEAIAHLLQRVQEMQDEMSALRNRLRSYSSD